jgi:predicted RNA-binding protein YlxR (DUF448 family)
VIVVSTTEQRAPKKAPERTCLGCGRRRHSSRLVRLVRAPDGEVHVDHPHRLGGRGGYVCGLDDCIARTLRSAKLDRALGGRVVRPSLPVLRQRVIDQLLRRLGGLLAASARSGKVSLGAAKTEEALSRGIARLVVVATDVSPRVRGRLDQAAANLDVHVMVLGDRHELAKPFARTELGALALTDDGLSQAVSRELALLQGLTAIPCTDTPPAREGGARERAT